MAQVESDKCPICGRKTLKVLPMRIEGKPICTTCSGSISMDPDRINKLTLDELNAHLKWREKNEIWHSGFHTEEKYMDIFDNDWMALMVDRKKERWYVNNKYNPPIFSFLAFVAFRYELRKNMIHMEIDVDDPYWKTMTYDIGLDDLKADMVGIEGALRETSIIFTGFLDR